MMSKELRKLLEATINGVINGDTQAASTAFGNYLELKAAFILEKKDEEDCDDEDMDDEDDKEDDEDDEDKDEKSKKDDKEDVKDDETQK